MGKKYYALVKWIGGTDDKTYTSGVPTDWILGFDYEAYINDGHDVTETQVVEWRDKKKKPKGGWHCYDCHVVLVSDRILHLENHLKILEGAKFPKIVEIENSTTTATGGKNLPSVEETPSQGGQHVAISDEEDPYFSVQKKSTHKKRLFLDSDEDLEKNEAGPSRSKVQSKFKAKKRYSRSNAENTDEDTCSDAPTVVLSPAKSESNESFGARHKNPKTKQPKRPTLADVMAGIIENKNAIKSLQDEFVKFKQGTSVNPPVRRPKYDNQSGTSYKNARDLDDGEFIEGNVEIGAPGSGVFVTDLQWTSAISKGTYKAMATTLVMALFPLDVLLKSNYKGGDSKLKKTDGPRPKYHALDGKIIKAIMYSVRGMYPKPFTETGVGQAINVKLTNLRAKRGLPEGSEGSSN